MRRRRVGDPVNGPAVTAPAHLVLMVELVEAGSMTFVGEPGVEWVAKRAAESFVKAAGWSIGPSDRSQCRGVLFSTAVAVSKWHVLTSIEQAGCDAVVTGDSRNGPLTLTVTACGRKRAAAKIAAGGPDINDVYRYGFVASNEAEAVAQARRQVAPFIERPVVFDYVIAGLTAEWDERESFTSMPGEIIVAHVDMLDVDRGWEVDDLGGVLYPDWVLSADNPDQLVIHQETGTQFRLGDLYDLTFQPPGVGTREGHHRSATLIEPSRSALS